MAKATFCGIKIKVSGVRIDNGMPYGYSRGGAIDAKTATRLAHTVRKSRPKPGTQIKICDRSFVGNMGGRFFVRQHGSDESNTKALWNRGGFRGAKRRRTVRRRVRR